MWFIRRVQSISYTKYVTNVEVLRRANTKRKLLSEMVNRQVKFFGHVMRKEEMENLVNYRLCRRQESSGPPGGKLPDVPAKDERKDTNRTDPPRALERKKNVLVRDLLLGTLPPPFSNTSHICR